jgi:stage II sporulation protein D
VINILDIESYIKGVIPKEMPLGKGEENFEALKAFAICARTYTLMKMKPGKNFDLYIDTRDQVYGGVDAEKPISNRAVDETRELILTYGKKPAVVFYHSTCGGKTENVENIFGIDTASYLSGIDDGINPYCSISPSFEWEEIFSTDLFIERLKLAGVVDSLFDVLKNVFIVNRFESGRVNELRIELSSSQTGEKKSVSLYGNNIRSIIRTTNNKSILKSIWFDLTLNENKNVIIQGRGYGHGVGLCQWGAVSLSRAGINFKEILFHYFPGTEISYINDKD